MIQITIHTVACFYRKLILWNHSRQHNTVLLHFALSRSRRKMYCGHLRLSVCLSVCLSAAACLQYCKDPDVTWQSGKGYPLLCTIARICNLCTGCVAMATPWKCVAEPSGNAPGPPHALCMLAATPIAGDKIDVPAACAIPFRPYCGVL